MTPFPYHKLIEQPLLATTEVAENAHSYLFLTERHMQAMWLEQKYFKSLHTEDGQPIEVLSPGIWNAETGPDFLKAHIRIGQQELRGDIELHLSEESWYHHQHHQDSFYEGVILHVSFWKPVKPQEICDAAGKVIHRTHLKSSLTIPESRIVKLIDLDLYPYKHFVGSGRCARTLFNKLSEHKTKTLFSSAALWRLKQKWQHLLAKVNDYSSEALLAGMAMALGYKQNTEAFFDIYCGMNRLTACHEQSLFAFALGQCGYFSEHYRRKWLESGYYQSLLGYHTSLSEENILSPITLRGDKVRPANHPIRRLAALAKIIRDPLIGQLPASLDHLWMSQWTKKKWPSLRKQLLEFIPSYTDQYWEYHYTFEKEPQKKPVALIGKDLKLEIIVNVCLPLLYAKIEQRSDPNEIEAFSQFYSALPGTKASKATYLNHRFFGSSSPGGLLKHADAQQGAYQIHRDFCLHFEASCVGCPFVERYTALGII